MRLSIVTIAVVASLARTAFAEDVKVEVTHAVDCERKSQKGDKISVRGSPGRVDGADVLGVRSTTGER